jgi:DNA-directed RNA polymerase specialized sigma subunit
MNAEEWLEQVKKFDQLINAKLAERERLIALATDISAKPIDGMPHSNTGTVSQTMQNAVVNLIMLAQEIDKLVDQYIDCKRHVVSVLETLPEKEYGVLHRHYIRYMTWEQIAEDMGYSTVQIWRIKNNGLKILQECNCM